MKQDTNGSEGLVVEREFLGKITVVEFVENIIKKHFKNNENTNESK